MAVKLLQKRFDVSSVWGAEERRASGREVTLQFDNWVATAHKILNENLKMERYPLIYFENLHEEARVNAFRKWTQWNEISSWIAPIAKMSLLKWRVFRDKYS